MTAPAVVVDTRRVEREANSRGTFSNPSWPTVDRSVQAQPTPTARPWSTFRPAPRVYTNPRERNWSGAHIPVHDLRPVLHLTFVGGRAKMRIRRARPGSGPVKHFVQRASPYAFGAVSQRLKGPHRKANPVSCAWRKYPQCTTYRRGDLLPIGSVGHALGQPDKSFLYVPRSQERREFRSPMRQSSWPDQSIVE